MGDWVTRYELFQFHTLAGNVLSGTHWYSTRREQRTGETVIEDEMDLKSL